MYRYALLTSLFLTLLLRLPAQQSPLPSTLSLESCLRHARTDAPQARIAQKAWEEAGWRYKSFRADLLPQIVLNLNTPGFTSSIISVLQPDGSTLFQPQNQMYSSANLGISQTLPWTGGNIFLRSGLNRLDRFSDSTISYSSVPLLVGFSQPIFRYNAVKWQRKVQPIQFRAAGLRYRENLEDVNVDIANRFFDAYIAQLTVENARLNLAINDTVYRISKGRYSVGKIAENELLQTELAWMNARSQYERARLDSRRAIADLAIALGMSPVDSVNLTPPPPATDIAVDEDFAWEKARANRSEMQNFERRRIELESSIAQARWSNRFNASVDASFGLNNSAATLPEVYESPSRQQAFTVGLNIPLYQWGKAHAEISAAEAAKAQAETQLELEMLNLERDVKFQVQDFLQLQEQVKLAGISDTIAQRRFEVAKNRYLIGKIDITNLLIAQQEKDQARQSYIQTLKQFWVSYYRLRRATLYDFRTRQEIVDVD